MLVLSRKLKQSIRIGDSITVTILHVKGNTIRVGIDAPKDVRIMRSELSDFLDPAAPLDANAVDAPKLPSVGTNRIRSLNAPPTGLSSRIAEMRLRPGLDHLATTTQTTVPLPR